jgi:IS5 family transposase
LALVAGQDVEPGEVDGTWRIARRVAPDRTISVVDPEARHMHKSRSEYRDGYKAHIAIDPETGLITAAAITPANAGDGPAGVALLADEAPGLQVLADAAYAGGETRACLRGAGHDQAIKPNPLRTAVPGGFNRDDFIVDHATRTMTCPAGHTVAITTKGNATFGVRCRDCPLRDQCTTAKDGRIVHIGEHDTELVEARRAWRDGDFAADYRRWRPMVERAIAWLVARGHRRVRYRGIERNQLGLSHRAAAINLRRLINLGLTRDGPTWILSQ